MKRRTVLVLGSSILAAVCAWLGSRLVLDGDLARLLPDSDPELRRTSALIERLMQRMVIDLAIEEESEDRLQRLEVASDRLAATLEKSALVTRVRASALTADVQGIVDLLFESTPRLFDPRDHGEIEERLRPEAIERRLSDLKRRAFEPDSGFLLSHALEDPLGISSPVLASLETLAGGLDSARLVHGRIVSADGAHLLLVAEPSFPATDTARTEELLALLDAEIRELQSDPALAGLEVRHLGAHRGTLDNARQIAYDVRLTSTIGGLFVALIAILTLARFWWGLLALTPAIFGGAVALGTFSLFRSSIAAPVAGLGVALLGISIDYAIHVLYRLDSSGEGRIPKRALFAGATTTAFAFLALRISALPALREIGMVGALGIVASVLFAVFVLPELARTGGRARAGRPRVDLRRLLTVRSSRIPTRAALIALLLSPVVLAGALHLHVDGDVQHLSSLSPAARSDEERIFETWGEVFGTTQVVVTGADLESAWEANLRLERVLEAMTGEGEVGGFASISSILPPVVEQERRLAAWRAFWSPERLDALRRDLATAARPLGYDVEALGATFEWIASEPPALRLGDDSTALLAGWFEDRILSLGSERGIATPVFTDDWKQVVSLEDRLKREGVGALVFNNQAIGRRLAALVGGELWELGGLALVVVTLLVWLWLGAIELALLVMIPLLLSLGWTLGVLGWLGIPINLANSIFAAFLLGITVDYAIFTVQARLEAFRGQTVDLAETDASVLLCALTTCVGFGVLVTAGHPVLFYIGATALTGILSSLLATRLFVPVLARFLLRLPGPGGTPRLRHALRAWWVVRVMVGGALRYFLTSPRGVDAVRRRRAAQDAIRSICRRVQRDAPGGRRVVEGLEPETFTSPVVVVANHESQYDQIELLSLPVSLVVLIKPWVARAPVVGRITREAGYIVTGTSSMESILARARAVVSEGSSLLVYPEGSRTRDGSIGRFHNGAFALARALGVKVRPVALVNTRSVVRPETWWVGDHDSKVVVLDEVDPAEFPGDGGDRRMARAVRDRIREVCRREWLERQEGPGWHRPLVEMYAYLGGGKRRLAAHELANDPLLRDVPRLLACAENVLVVGSGLGLLAARLAVGRPECRVLVVEPDPDRVELARALLGSLRNVEVRAGALEGDLDDRFDHVLSVEELRSRSVEERGRLLVAIERVLLPDGRLLLRACGELTELHHHLRRVGFAAARALPGLAREGVPLLECTLSPLPDDPRPPTSPNPARDGMGEGR